MAVVIQIENLVKRYKELVALDHLNLEVEKGEIFGLLGPNGSGKSTTINCILALLKYDKGTVKVFGREMKPDSYDIKREIGVVMQDVAVFDELTVYENVDYFCGLYIRDKGLRKQYVEDAIAFVGLDEFRKFYPKKLSGGLLRRLNIACGIAHKPKLIFFDEPTVAVDPQSRNKILEGIQKLNEEGATIVYTTHYMEEAANAGRMMNMHPHLLADQQTFEVAVDNDMVQKYMQQLAPKIEAHLQEKLHNRKIRMTTRVSEANENVRAYSHVERFQMMSKKNPSLLKLKEALGLELS